MIGLTGPFRLRGVLHDGHAEIEAEAVPVATVRDDARGRETVVEQTYQVRARALWRVATGAGARALQEAASGVFEAEVRTSRDGDPDWAEPLALEMMATSDAVLTGPINRKDASGEVRYVVEVEMVSLREDLTPEALGLEIGAYVLTGEGEDYYDIEAEGAPASISDGPTQTVTLEDGTVLTIESFDFGDTRTSAARIDQSPTAYTDIQTREPAPSGPVAS